MDVKEAVTTAKKYLLEIYADESITNLGLEEVVFDNGTWNVTLGFSRPWDRPVTNPIITSASGLFSGQPRSYKVVAISEATGKVLSVKNREQR